MRITIALSAALLALSVGTANAQTASARAFTSEPRAFVVGKTVYLRSTKTRIGTIEAVDGRHAFPRTFPRPQMSAVLIHRKDGPMEWVPVEGITRIYVVGK